jgi:hypothetical protein
MCHARRVAAAITAIRCCAAVGAAAVVLAACGGEHLASPATASPAISPSAPHSSASASATTSALHFPNQLLGLNKNTSAAAKQSISILAKNYVSPMAGYLVGERSAIYGGGQNGATPFFFVAAGALPRPIAYPDNVAHSLHGVMSNSRITDAKVFLAGSNGTAVVCGHTDNMDTLCFWVDHKTFGAVLYPPGFASSLSGGASKTSQIHSAVVG